jgi:5-methylcytosine-specific restriction endonuclease McrA
MGSAYDPSGRLLVYPTRPEHSARHRPWRSFLPSARTRSPRDPDLYRRDAFGNEIYKPSFGKTGEKSWEIDHIRPLAKDGSENLRNLQPLQTAANREKDDAYPFRPKS